MHRLLNQLIEHLKLEDSEENSLLSFYLQSAERYVKRGAGYADDHLILLVAGIFYEYRVTEKSMGNALNSLTPLFVQAGMCGEDVGD
ncbi:phage gp6-like head-tail connector protein [Bacillus amyloliquefaciens]|uniref:head-tail connector protein n=1 Tax=Bacillus amyloliquefaciens TaxID=1390 RepID=UPI003D2EBD34